CASKLRDLLSLYYQNYDLIAIGAYKSGVNPKLDEAIKKIDKINAFLKQGTDESFSFEETLNLMDEI
ncbi:MAG: flagellum-specific ATP synthase FliI, partial [Oscillospiraceae bacterium]